MSKYNTVVVGTDGSNSSMLAVERAAEIASAFNSTLVIGCAYYESEEDAAGALRQDSNKILGGETARRTSLPLLNTRRSTVLPRCSRPFVPARQSKHSWPS